MICTDETTFPKNSLALDLVDGVSELIDENLSFNKLTIKAGKHCSTAASVKEVPRFIKTYTSNIAVQ